MVCNDMRCTVDPASRWNFYVHSVAIEPPYNGVPYDDDGPPDLVLEVVNPITGERVAFIEAAPNATSAEFIPPALAGANIPAEALSAGPGSHLIFRMNDRDYASSAEPYLDLTGADVWFDPVPFDGAVVTSSFSRDGSRMVSGFTVRWHLERADR
jgi:hypothetical protein